MMFGSTAIRENVPLVLMILHYEAGKGGSQTQEEAANRRRPRVFLCTIRMGGIPSQKRTVQLPDSIGKNTMHNILFQ